MASPMKLLGLNILFVNDDLYHLKYFIEEATDLGAKIFTAKDVETALDALANQPTALFHVLIVDMIMPLGKGCKQKYPQTFVRSKTGIHNHREGMNLIQTVREGADGVSPRDPTSLSVLLYAGEMPEYYATDAYRYNILRGFGAHMPLMDKVGFLVHCYNYHVLNNKDALLSFQPSKPKIADAKTKEPMSGIYRGKQNGG